MDHENNYLDNYLTKQFSLDWGVDREDEQRILQFGCLLNLSEEEGEDK